jgi:opacity protein-like surface antigen
MPALGVRLLLAVVVFAGARAAPAQEPAGPPPPSSRVQDKGTEVLELLPGIGRIGAQAGLIVGVSQNPYDVGGGVQGAGFLDVPLGRVGGGKLSYQILIGYSDARSDPFVLTDSVAFVANLAAGASPAAALAGPPGAPFPVLRSVRTEMHLLEVAPFGLKYTITAFDRARIRPYLAAGADVVVVITNQRPEKDESLVFTGTAPFDADLIAGLLGQAPELEARGIPSGQGNLEAGFHAGAGVEVRLTKGLSINLDYRYTAIGGTRHSLQSFSSGLGIHW